MNEDIENNNLDYLESIQVKKKDTEWFYKAIEDNNKRIWIFSHDLDDTLNRFTGNPLNDIKRAYKKFYQIEIDNYSVHFLLAPERNIKTIIPELTDFPVIFITEENHFKMPIILNDIDLHSI